MADEIENVTIWAPITDAAYNGYLGNAHTHHVGLPQHSCLPRTNAVYLYWPEERISNIKIPMILLLN